MVELTTFVVFTIHAVLFVFKLFVGWVWIGPTFPILYLLWQSVSDIEDLLMMLGITGVWLAITLAWAYWVVYTFI